ncbi:SNF2-related protein [Alicyclobacillus fastidiosus]|uniref:SNF2-related protein n=2 Tax=Alicyclobacillus fastidiosus TaxID=392011 RepID=A0ABV5AFS8_9BACL|nr:SNF2-related protein [Alicyclobacillus fastidiosus]WEH11699.1 SNF2-related protein [Alicyclobacillus fastidiosus]
MDLDLENHSFSETLLEQAMNTDIRFEVQMVDNDLETAFNAYLAGVSTDDSPTAWKMFHLAAVATQSRMSPTFESLLVMDHISGFTPLPHQVQTAERVLKELRGRAILADEVGLGKTIEAGLILKEYMLRGLVKKALILVPASLVLQWTRELNEKFQLSATAQRNEWTWEQYDVVVASLDTAKRPPHREAVLAQPWDMVIIDEAHKLKNHRTKNWQMANAIPNKYLLLLTATPMQNQLQELHTLVTLLKPGHLGSVSQFSTNHVASRRTPRDAERLRETMGDIMIRNRRQDGATSLPPRQVEVVELELNAQERRFYDGIQSLLRDEYESRKSQRVSMLPLLTLQREICSSPYAAMISLEKMQKKSTSQSRQIQLAELIQLGSSISEYTKIGKVLELIDEIDDKCIVFTEYRATQDFIMYMLKKKGVSAVPFRGGFKRGKKDWMKDLFSKKAQVLVATESGGEGINLQFCNNMINFDLPWNPMRLEQRIGRIHRLGQTQTCYVYNLATRETIEEHIVKLLHEKIRMFESVIGELDYIVSDKRLANWDKELFEATMTSTDAVDLASKLNQMKEQYLQ